MTIPASGSAHLPSLSPDWDRHDVLGAWKVRWGIGRDRYRMDPGLYRLGDPGAESPVLVTCNYKLTVDVLRRDAAGLDAWLLVLDTNGVNVWCAAGKGTFATDNLVRSLLASDLPLLVDHTTLVVPQLGATGIAAHEVARATGWRVVFGPIRARDLGEFIGNGMKATAPMRSVTFTLAERAELAPVELVQAFTGKRWIAPVALVALSAVLSWANPGALGGPGAVWLLPLSYLAGVLAGTVGVPLLLPWLPGRAFSVKGAAIGALLGGLMGWLVGAAPLVIAASVLASGSISSFLGLNFTGSTPYTSPSGVEKELRASLPLHGISLAVALIMVLANHYLR